jgi:FtsZ-binding cell division protein ZapB
MSLESIDQLAAIYRAAYDEAAQLANEIDEAIEAIRSARAEEIYQTAQQVNEAHTALQSAIRANKHLFKSPKSRVLHGIRCGYKKSTPSAKVPKDKEEQVRAIVERDFAFLFPRLFTTTHIPVTEEFKRLDENTLMALGLTKPKSVNKAFADPTDSDMKKLVEALIKRA